MNNDLEFSRDDYVVYPSHGVGQIEEIEKEMIAGVVNFILNSKVVLAFYISHMEKYQEL